MEQAITVPSPKRAAAAPTVDSEAAFSSRFMAPLLIGAALNPINSSLIATALVPIARDLSVSAGRVTILVSALYLATAVMQPAAGRAADVLGARRVFLAGCVLVTVGGLAGAFAHDLRALTTARLLIGTGTSAGYPSAMALVSQRSPGKALPGPVLGRISMIGNATVAVGPAVGGLLVTVFGWRSTFLINVPCALLAAACALAWIDRDPPARERPSASAVLSRLDLPGMLLFGATACALVIYLQQIPHADPSIAGAALALACLLIAWERRARTPFFDVRQLAAHTALTRTYLRTALTLLGVYTVLYGLTPWLQSAAGYSAQAAGLLILPMGMLAALINGPVAARGRVRRPLTAAALAMAAASAVTLRLTASSSIWPVLTISLAFGVTVGAATSANQTALTRQAPRSELGTVSGLFRTFTALGSIASSAVISTVYAHGVSDHGLHTAAWILIAVSAGALAMTLLDTSLRD
ncbi:MFS transporter [Streptomyces sp. NPDC047022]|uniref:MFS transporter n=1 Tax=Streptomyces sp. NPDC047022 TaxID=3155737 RepID=UPI0033EB65E2